MEFERSEPFLPAVTSTPVLVPSPQSPPQQDPAVDGEYSATFELQLYNRPVRSIPESRPRSIADAHDGEHHALARHEGFHNAAQDFDWGHEGVCGCTDDVPVVDRVRFNGAGVGACEED